MKKETIIITVVWIKRLVGIVAFGAWGYIMISIANLEAPFEEQAPYCMGSTMLIFGLISLVYKGLDYWILEQKS